MSWKKQHNYLTLVADHRAGKIVWGGAGAGEKAADRFFAELDPGSPWTASPLPADIADASSPPAADTVNAPLSARERWAKHDPKPPVAQHARQLTAISLDMGAG